MLIVVFLLVVLWHLSYIFRTATSFLKKGQEVNFVTSDFILTLKVMAFVTSHHTECSTGPHPHLNISPHRAVSRCCPILSVWWSPPSPVASQQMLWSPHLYRSRQTEGQRMDGWTDGCTDGWTKGHTHPLFSTTTSFNTIKLAGNAPLNMEQSKSANR